MMTHEAIKGLHASDSGKKEVERRRRMAAHEIRSRVGQLNVLNLEDFFSVL